MTVYGGGDPRWTWYPQNDEQAIVALTMAGASAEMAGEVFGFDPAGVCFPVYQNNLTGTYRVAWYIDTEAEASA